MCKDCEENTSYISYTNSDLELLLEKAKCCFSCIVYKHFCTQQLGIIPDSCYEDKISYLILSTNLLQRYINDNVCTKITIQMINNIVQNISLICKDCPSSTINPSTSPIITNYILQGTGFDILIDNSNGKLLHN